MIDVDTGQGIDRAVIRPQGRLTMVTAPQLRDAITDLVRRNRIHIVADLSTTEFMDSSGLGALISGLKTARRAGGDLRIACLSQQVATIMRLANLDRVLQPYSSIAEAFNDR